MALQLKALGVDNVLQFPFMDAPPVVAIARALELLLALGALDNQVRCSEVLPICSPRVGHGLAMCVAVAECTSIEFTGCSSIACTKGFTHQH